MMVSACLAGVRCVYDGTHNAREPIVRMHQAKRVLLFCPEMLGGMKVPHPPSEIRGGSGADVWKGRASVVSKDGQDVTEYFLKGAKAVLELALENNIRQAVLKAKSPSCGCGLIFDGTFTGTLIPGDGVATALLKENGIAVVSDVEFLRDTPNGPWSASNDK